MKHRQFKREKKSLSWLPDISHQRNQVKSVWGKPWILAAKAKVKIKTATSLLASFFHPAV